MGLLTATHSICVCRCDSGYVIKVRKVLDDVFFFLYVLLLAIALRAIWTTHFP